MHEHFGRVWVEERTNSGNISELEATGGGESLDVRFEGQGRVKGYSEAADFGDRGKILVVLPLRLLTVETLVHVLQYHNVYQTHAKILVLHLILASCKAKEWEEWEEPEESVDKFHRADMEEQEESVDKFHRVDMEEQEESEDKSHKEDMMEWEDLVDKSHKEELEESVHKFPKEDTVVQEDLLE
ncbi:unnamed protein product [Ranitomeya imitator]|uniref:Uncharacterized protein n=1 Tax=Ranitomeya imitator TaxID=111125 RepID=A0ABN9MN23_9NEOB|nr:unnamed protein product [Ranitomeya imitator]